MLAAKCAAHRARKATWQRMSIVDDGRSEAAIDLPSFGSFDFSESAIRIVHLRHRKPMQAAFKSLMQCPQRDAVRGDHELESYKTSRLHGGSAWVKETA